MEDILKVFKELEIIIESLKKEGHLYSNENLGIATITATEHLHKIFDYFSKYN